MCVLLNAKGTERENKGFMIPKKEPWSGGVGGKIQEWCETCTKFPALKVLRIWVNNLMFYHLHYCLKKKLIMILEDIFQVLLFNMAYILVMMTLCHCMRI